jgi:hypothetical protein
MITAGFSPAGMGFTLLSPPTIHSSFIDHSFPALRMPPPINQEFSHKREPNQIKRVEEPSGIPDERFHASAYEPNAPLRRRDRSSVELPALT